MPHAKEERKKESKPDTQARRLLVSIGFDSGTEQMGALDDALLPAALCAASYAKKSYAFDVATGKRSLLAYFGGDQEEPSAAQEEVGRANFVVNMCKPMTAQQLVEASFEEGVWRKGSLEQALCAVSKNEFRSVVGYFLWTYPRIEKHATNFETLPVSPSNTCSIRPMASTKS
jgi:hypothetical protein